MLKYMFIGLSFLCLFNIAAHASPESINNPGHKEGIGLGIGALIGGLIAGPPGAIIGAAGGAWFGDKHETKDGKISGLEKRLVEKQTELAYLQNQFTDLQSAYGKELQKVKLDKQFSALDKLSRGVSLTVHFRTDSANIDQAAIPRIERLAGFLKDLPEVQLQLEAHADQRGAPYYNKRLSQLRAQSVRNELIRAGIPANRIHIHAHGETQAKAVTGDREAYVFDRRVTILLTLDSET